MMQSTAWVAAFLVLACLGVVRAAIYSGPCLQNCCCKVCSAPENQGYPYGVTTVDIQTNPSNPVVQGASCHFPVWSDRQYNKTDGTPATPPNKLWWTDFSVFADVLQHSAPTTCDCCKLSVDTSCAEQPPLAARPKHFYIVGGTPVEQTTATLVFEQGVQLSTGDYIELRNDTFCGYTRPMYVRRSTAAQLTVTPDATDPTLSTNTWVIPRLPNDGCYRICYYHSGLTTPTWYDMGTITVFPTSNPATVVTYQLDSLDIPLTGNTVTLRFKGSGLLSVWDDAVQLRTTATACGSATGFTESTVPANNGILNVADGKDWCQPAVVPGITSLRPLRYITPVYSDCPTQNRLYTERLEWTLKLPAANTYRVCYRKGAAGAYTQIGTITVTPQTAAYLALQALYTSTNGPTTWTRKSGWTGTNACLMYGVKCDSGGNVISINLGRNNLNGPIPTTFFTSAFFSTLTYLALDENAITGTIPREIGVLRNLVYLNLGVNQLTGTLPETLARTSLQNIYTPMNALTGTVPSDLASLRELWYKYNSMTDYVAAPYKAFCPFDPLECSDRGSTDLGVYPCGYSSITEAECVARDCCFNSQAPLVFGGTSCFTKRSAFIQTHPACSNSITCQVQVPPPPG